MASRKSRRADLANRSDNLSPQADNEAPSSSQGRVGLSVRSTSYSGPMLPQQLAAYENSEAGRLYVRAMIKQSEHRMELEKLVITGDDKRANRGQYFGLLIALVFCGAGVWLVYLGHDAAGTTIATAAVVGLVTAFVTGSTQRKEERIKKAKIMVGQEEAEEDEPVDKNLRLPGMS